MTSCSIAARPILGTLRCCDCGAADLLSIAPGSDIGTLSDPQPVVADRGWCAAHWPYAQNTAGLLAPRADPAASQHAGTAGARSLA